MLARLVTASLTRRFRQLALVLAAVTVAAATVVTLVGFSARAEGRIGDQLAAFGANLVVRPQVGGPERLPAAVVERVRAIAGVRSAEGAAEAPAAAMAATAGLADVAPGVDRIEVRADPGRLDEVARAIEARVAGAEAVPLRRVSESDAALTRRLTLLLAAASAVSLALALLSVGAATTALVGERRREIGLMLALGYTGRRVGGLFAAELLAAALVAGLAGQLLGEIAAGRLAGRLLGTASGPALTWGGLAAAAGVAVAVVGIAMTAALRRVERLDAAQVLRGE